MTKDEIIEHHCNVFDLIDKGQLHHVESAMDQWAKQQAIEFAKWICSDTPIWRHGVPKSTQLTNEEVYDLFIEQQNKDK